MIVDASVAVKWVVFEDGSEQALDLLGRDLAAPTIWLAEASNALRTKCARGEISEDEASEFALDLADAPVAPLALKDLLPVAMRMALDLKHATYDCFYLAAALRKDTKLVTADRRLLTKAAAHPYLAGRAIMLGGCPEVIPQPRAARRARLRPDGGSPGTARRSGAR